MGRVTSALRRGWVLPLVVGADWLEDWAAARQPLHPRAGHCTRSVSNHSTFRLSWLNSSPTSHTGRPVRRYFSA